MDWQKFIQQSLEEDVGEADHTSLSCIQPDAKGSARLLLKADGILAGVELAEQIFLHLDPSAQFNRLLHDGDEIHKGQIAFELSGNACAILTGERLVLNCMQRMSGIATLTRKYVQAVEGYKARILDTRKTTPLFRAAEKWAVKIGGGENHRFGLFDMILIKDNHIDYAGGITMAIESVKKYQQGKNLALPVEIEARTLSDVELILETGSVSRILLDNFSIDNLMRAVKIISGKLETEASGGISIENVRDVAATGVDFISVGALTHSYHSLDMSLKASI